ncbi:helicase with zinc finger domain 2-like [Saccostrea cucullata]|uniref:helicase with zinc finger domain 2-like n=1 Tax=Saccostrea cuccullata TaxID=36930 RepID=UPI002ED4E5E6
MSSESDDDESNFYELDSFFGVDCTRLLRKLLEHCFPVYKMLLEELTRWMSLNPNGIISKEDQSLIQMESSVSRKFKFALLCNIFRTGVCDSQFPPPSNGWFSEETPPIENCTIGDNILTLWQIFTRYISRNKDKEISDTECETIWNTIQSVGESIAEKFSTLGKHFLKKLHKKLSGPELQSTNNSQFGENNRLEHNALEYSTETIICNQYGIKNKISSRSEGERSVKTIICNQFGERNKVAISLADHTKRKVDIEGKDLRITMHSDDKKCWPELVNEMSSLSITDLNEDQCMKENSTKVLAIQRKCLIVDVRIEGSEMENSIEKLLKCLMEKINACQILQDKNMTELRVFGYYYYPCSYIDQTDLDMDFILYNHATFKLMETVSDVDIFVSNSLNMLIQNSFKADVDESIRVQIKGDVVEPKNLRFSEIQRAFIEHAEKQLPSISNSLAAECHLHIMNILKQNSTTHVILKTESCITYGCLVDTNGPVVTLLKKIFQIEGVQEKLSDVSLIKIGVLVNTSMDEEFQEESGKGIVFYLSPESKIVESIEKNKFPEVLQAMLGQKASKILKGTENLKIRAVLDYGNGQNGDDSDQAIDITETYEEESTEETIKRSLQQAESALQSGNILQAKELARNVFKKLSDKDIDIFDELKKIFQECADNCYALKCFCKVRLLGNEFWNPAVSLMESRNYWISVIRGPYTLEEILILFKEIEKLTFEYLLLDAYSLIAVGICCELQMSYGELIHAFHLDRDNSFIKERRKAVAFHVCKMYHRQGQHNLICAIYKQKDRDSDTLDADDLFLWASALKDLGKLDVALKKTEEAIQIKSTEQTRNALRDLRESLILELNQVPKTQSNLDVEWLAGTNISLPQQMKEKALQVKKKHVKRAGSHYRPKRPERERLSSSTFEETGPQGMPYEDTSKYKTWKDVPPSVPEPSATYKKKNHKGKKKTEINEDYNVEVVEKKLSESDSGQESFSENENPKPISYIAPEYTKTETDTQSDSGIDTVDDESQIDYEHSAGTNKILRSSDLVIFGITLKDRCKTSFQKNKTSKSFQYQDELSLQEIKSCLQRNKEKYKRCVIEIESAHKAICRNLDLGDDVKEILISGRSKCGKAFTDDEVVVEILGESKAQSSYIPRLKIDLAKERKDNNIYGKVIGRLKRNRYGDLDHPVLICSKDEFADHMMKPLCRTVPKINVSHEHCKHKYQVDLFSYDSERNVADYHETLDINLAHQKAYCFLVAIINWDDMYPFGIVLKVINTKGDINSGIGILRLQHRVPSAYSQETREMTASILQRKERMGVGGRKVVKAFVINDGKQCAMEAAYSVNLLNSGLYRVGIHIVDPTYIIKKGDAIDLEARRRGTDFYVNKDIQPVYMIPEDLSYELFNLGTGKERETLTVYFDVSIDDNFDPLNENVDIEGRVERVVIKTVESHKISDVQTRLKTKTLKSDIHILHKISQRLREQRLGKASLFTDVNEMFPYENNNFIECMDADILREELHIFANQTVAKLLFEKYPKCIPLKCHDRPSENALLRWKKAHNEYMDKILFCLQDCEIADRAVCSIFDCNPEKIRYRHLISVQSNVWQVLREAAERKQFDKLQLVLGADEIHPLQALAVEEWVEIQDSAEYKCAIRKQEAMHFNLRVPLYTSFTSPLSRFTDLVVHRLVHAALDNVKEPPYNEIEIQSICEEMNNVNRSRKQFQKSCLILLFAHSLNSQPQVFNGFIQNVTNNDVELIIPTLRKLSRSSKLLPINLLHSRQKPEFEKEVGSDRYFMTIKWQNRIYSLKRITKNPPKENDYLRIDPHQKVQFRHLKKWVNTIQALLSKKTRNIYSLMLGEDPISNQQIPASWNTVNDVSSEVRGGHFAQQVCNYSLSFNYGQMVSIQMCAESERGILTPLPQLFDITPNVKICLQHARDPLGVLSKMATKPTKEKYSTCKDYIDIWMPIFSMEVAIQTADDDSFTINDLPVTFRKQGGAFSLKHSFLEKRDIEFTAHSVDLLSNEDRKTEETQEETERFYMSGSDFLCIRCPLEPKSNAISNFGNGAICSQDRYWVGHAQVSDVRFKSKKGEKVDCVTFVCHNRSPPIPQEMLNKKKECNVEILPKSDVSRRTELYVKWLESASDLAKAIALRKRIPELDKIHKDLGDRVRDLDVPELGIAYNSNQRKAVKQALTSSFSLIQGPPGTGKTFTGVALINLFCSINQKYSELKGGNKHFVVFCGPSNKSVDLVTDYLKKCFKNLKILRMYGGALECKEFPIPGKVISMKKSESAPDENLREVTLHHIIRRPGNEHAEKIRDFDRKFKNEKSIDYRDIKQYKKYIARAIKEEIPKYDVILCTTAVATSSRLLNSTGRSIYQLLIDEAGMCTEPECVATIVATHAKQVVLIGDHKQLRPVILCEEAAELGLQKSLFERYAESEKSDKVLTFLTNQYRMHPSLCRFPSNTFYYNRLITQKSPKWEVLQPLNMWRNPKNPLVFCHIEGEEEYLANTTEEGNEMSKFNTAEIDHVEKVYLHLVKREGVAPENINIMSQYNAQCSKIRERLKKHHVQHVNTVVASQGGEWDYVIFSLVRSIPDYRIEPHPTIGWCKENLGFITDKNQINVALTRARKGLVIIGNKRLMNCNETFKSLLKEYARHGCVEDAENFPLVLKGKDHRKA